MTNTNQNQKGFTLVELIITVSIIAILAAIAIPRYYKFLNNAREASALSFLATIMKAEEAYRIYSNDELYTGDFEELETTGMIPNSTGGSTITRNVYQYQLSAGSDADGPFWLVTASPVVTGSSLRTFSANQTGISR